MKKPVAALLVFIWSAASNFAQFAPAPIQPVHIDPVPNHIDLVPNHIDLVPNHIDLVPNHIDLVPNHIDPPTQFEPSEAAKVEEVKLQTAASERIFAYQKVILNRTTSVTDHDDGTYSVRADFSISSNSVSIRCVSTVRAAVFAFLEYINRIFGGSGSTDNWSLEMIVAGARQDIANRQGLSGAEITLIYIDQFQKTHVVQISSHELAVMLASK